MFFLDKRAIKKLGITSNVCTALAKMGMPLFVLGHFYDFENILKNKK